MPLTIAACRRVGAPVVAVLLLAVLAGCAHRTPPPPTEPPPPPPVQTPAPPPAPAPAATPTPVPSPPDLDRLCAGILNSYECAQAIERAQLERVDGVRRDGAKLLIETGQAGTIELSDRRAGADLEVAYAYREALTAIGQHVVTMQYWEGGETLLIDMRTGEQTVVAAPPVASPDGRRFVVAASDLGAAYGPTLLEVWRVGESAVSREWGIEIGRDSVAPSWGPSAPEWLGSAAVLFRRLGQGERPAGWGLLRLGDDGWELIQPCAAPADEAAEVAPPAPTPWPQVARQGGGTLSVRSLSPEPGALLDRSSVLTAELEVELDASFEPGRYLVVVQYASTTPGTTFNSRGAAVPAATVSAPLEAGSGLVRLVTPVAPVWDNPRLARPISVYFYLTVLLEGGVERVMTSVGPFRYEQAE